MSMGQTVVRFAVRRDNLYFNDDGNWGPIYLAKLWKANPHPHIPPASLVVMVSVTTREMPYIPDVNGVTVTTEELPDEVE